jgi:hypothetical protein
VRCLRTDIGFVESLGEHLLAGSTGAWDACLEDPGRLYCYRRSKVLMSFTSPGGGRTQYLRDPRAGTLYACVGGGALLQFNSRRKVWSAVNLDEARDEEEDRR